VTLRSYGFDALPRAADIRRALLFVDDLAPARERPTPSLSLIRPRASRQMYRLLPFLRMPCS
jgi:hypothetical protein